MDAQRNTMGIIAFILAFVASGFVLAPQIFPKTATPQEIQQSQEDLENYVADTAIGIGDKILDRVKDRVNNAAEDASIGESLKDSVTRVGVGLGRNILDRDTTNEAAESEVSTPSSKPSATPIETVSTTPSITQTPVASDWRDSFPRIGMALALAAVFAAAVAVIRKENRTLSKMVFGLSIGVLAMGLILMFIESILLAAGLIAVAILISAALSSLGDFGLGFGG